MLPQKTQSLSCSASWKCHCPILIPYSIRQKVCLFSLKWLLNMALNWAAATDNTFQHFMQKNVLVSNWSKYIILIITHIPHLWSTHHCLNEKCVRYSWEYISNYGLNTECMKVSSMLTSLNLLSPKSDQWCTGNTTLPSLFPSTEKPIWPQIARRTTSEPPQKTTKSMVPGSHFGLRGCVSQLRGHHSLHQML